MGVVEFYIVLSFWVNGSLIRQHSDLIPTFEECQKHLKFDLEQRRRFHGDAEGHCLSTPPRPEDVPAPKRKSPEA